jgi:hypothetical protein
VKAKLGALVHISREHFREAFEQAALGTPVTEAPPTSKSNPTKDPYAQDESDLDRLRGSAQRRDRRGWPSSRSGGCWHHNLPSAVYEHPIRFEKDSIAENGRLVAYPA